MKSFSIILSLILITILSLGCSEDKSPIVPEATFDIVGVWEVTEIEGAGPVDGSNSTWTFKSNGDYTWFLELDTRHFNGAGDYNLDGKALYCEVFGALGLPSTVNITTSEHTFSFPDGDGDRWTYSRVQ
jgi:hypothetical protein